MENNKTLLFLDTEFTGLRQDTELISIGITGSFKNQRYSFYAEYNDYDRREITDWVRENVIKNLKFPEFAIKEPKDNRLVFMKDNSENIKLKLTEWLAELGLVEIWSDCLAYDWVLFNNIFNNQLPSSVYYIPFDIATLFKINGIDPDIGRERYANVEDLPMRKHNALYDAWVIEKCYNKLMCCR